MASNDLERAIEKINMSSFCQTEEEKAEKDFDQCQSESMYSPTPDYGGKEAELNFEY